MGRQSILELRFGYHKVDLNRNVNLYFLCPDGKIRLFMTKSTRTIIELLEELAKRVKIPAENLQIIHKGRVIKPLTKSGEKTTPMFFKMHDNDILRVVVASDQPEE